MAFRDSGKTKLSKGILEMKFMKRSKEKAIQESQEEEGRLLFGSQMTEGMRAGIGNYIIESSYLLCEGLIDGRLSFRGMNPEIERLMELEELAKRPPVDRSMDADVTDADMANFRHSLVETVASKYNTKRTKKSKDSRNISKGNESLSKPQQPPRKKQKFLKPKDE